MKIFWMVFAFFFLAIVIGGGFANIVYAKELTPKSYVPTLISLPALIALFGYAFHKPIWKSGLYFWRAYLFIFIAFNIYQDSHISGYSVEDWIGYGFSLVIMLICYTGVYLYAFRFLGAITLPKQMP